MSHVSSTPEGCQRVPIELSSEARVQWNLQFLNSTAPLCNKSYTSISIVISGSTLNGTQLGIRKVPLKRKTRGKKTAGQTKKEQRKTRYLQKIGQITNNDKSLSTGQTSNSGNNGEEGNSDAGETGDGVALQTFIAALEAVNDDITALGEANYLDQHLQDETMVSNNKSFFDTWHDLDFNEQDQAKHYSAFDRVNGIVRFNR